MDVRNILQSSQPPSVLGEPADVYCYGNLSSFFVSSQGRLTLTSVKSVSDCLSKRIIDASFFFLPCLRDCKTLHGIGLLFSNPVVALKWSWAIAFPCPFALLLAVLTVTFNCISAFHFCISLPHVLLKWTKCVNSSNCSLINERFSFLKKKSFVLRMILRAAKQTPRLALHTHTHTHAHTLTQTHARAHNLIPLCH